MMHVRTRPWAFANDHGRDIFLPEGRLAGGVHVLAALAQIRGRSDRRTPRKLRVPGCAAVADGTVRVYFSLEITLIASIAYSTWNRRPSGLKVFTPRSYSLRVRNISSLLCAVLVAREGGDESDDRRRDRLLLLESLISFLQMISVNGAKLRVCQCHQSVRSDSPDSGRGCRGGSQKSSCEPKTPISYSATLLGQIKGLSYCRKCGVRVPSTVPLFVTIKPSTSIRTHH